MMRSALLTVLLFTITQPLYAERETLIEHDAKWNLFSKFELSGTEIDGESAAMGGISAGGLLNDNVGLGIAANILVDSVDLESGSRSIDSGDLWYGGAYVEYVFSPESLVYVSMDLLIGAGELNVTGNFNGDDSETVFALEPSLNVMINVTETFNIGLGVSYRLIENVDFEYLDSSDLSGVSGSVFLRFTQF